MGDAPEIGLIHGIPAKSEYEWFVALALWKFKWSFNYQAPFNGGSSVRGGFTVDFIVTTIPVGTPLFIMGERWHKNLQSEQDRLQVLFLTNEFAKRLKPPVIWEDNRVKTKELAEASVRKEFGRAR